LISSPLQQTNHHLHSEVSQKNDHNESYQKGTLKKLTAAFAGGAAAVETFFKLIKIICQLRI